MSTHKSQSVVPSSATPNVPASPGSQEVQGPVSATPVAAGRLPSAASPDMGAVAAAKGFRITFGPMRDSLTPHMYTLLPGKARVGTVGARRLAVMPRVVTILRDYPALAPRSNPDVIDAEIASADAMLAVAADLDALSVCIKVSVRQGRFNAWLLVNAGLIAAEHLAKTDQNMAAKVASIRDALRVGKRTDTALVTSAVAGGNASKAQAKATRAQARAAAASQAHTRTTQAHVARHPVVMPATVNQGPAVTTPADASGQGPAAIPASVYQGPAVNPQGPAR